MNLTQAIQGTWVAKGPVAFAHFMQERGKRARGPGTCKLSAPVEASRLLRAMRPRSRCCYLAILPGATMYAGRSSGSHPCCNDNRSFGSSTRALSPLWWSRRRRGGVDVESAQAAAFRFQLRISRKHQAKQRSLRANKSTDRTRFFCCPACARRDGRIARRLWLLSGGKMAEPRDTCLRQIE